METISEFDFNPLVPGVVYTPFRVFRQNTTMVYIPNQSKVSENSLSSNFLQQQMKIIL
jgi:hypothetical protein